MIKFFGLLILTFCNLFVIRWTYICTLSKLWNLYFSFNLRLQFSANSQRYALDVLNTSICRCIKYIQCTCNKHIWKENESTTRLVLSFCFAQSDRNVVQILCRVYQNTWKWSLRSSCFQQKNAILILENIISLRSCPKNLCIIFGVFRHLIVWRDYVRVWY